MFYLAFFLGIMTDVKQIEIVRPITLESVPESYGRYIQRPTQVEFDDRGRFYILDLSARVIWVWEKDGRFLTHFGQEGGGPGEFTFQGRYGRHAFLSIVGEHIFVYDGPRKEVSEFDLNFQYIRSRNLRGHGGRTRYFSMTGNQNMLLWQFNSAKEIPTQELALFDQDLNLIKSFYKKEEKTYERVVEGGKVVRWLVHAYRVGITMFCDTAGSEIMVGETDKPEFDIFDSQGNKKTTIRFKPLPNDLTDEDKEEFLMLPYLKREKDRYQVVFPKEKPYYDVIMPVGNDRVLVYSRSPYFQKIRGLVLDRSGQRLGRFFHECGENGGLYGARGRLLAIQTDEDGDFNIQELKFN